MRTIWKTRIDIADYQAVTLPAKSRPLSVHLQDGLVCMWWLVPDSYDPEHERVMVKMFGTGNPCDIEDDDTFVGTVLTHGSSLVWHVFVEARREAA